MIRNDISHLQPENPPLTLEEYVMQMVEERANSSVNRARDFQRGDPNFEGMLADQVGVLDPMMDPRRRRPPWEGALDQMAGASF